MTARTAEAPTGITTTDGLIAAPLGKSLTEGIRTEIDQKLRTYFLQSATTFDVHPFELGALMNYTWTKRDELANVFKRFFDHYQSFVGPNKFPDFHRESAFRTLVVARANPVGELMLPKGFAETVNQFVSNARGDLRNIFADYPPVSGVFGPRAISDLLFPELPQMNLPPMLYVLPHTTAYVKIYPEISLYNNKTP